MGQSPFSPLFPYRCRAMSCVERMHMPKLMCSRHWARVPEHLQRELVALYTPGQFDRDGGPNRVEATPEWSFAAVQAICAVALKDGLINEAEAKRRVRTVEEVMQRHNQRRAREEGGQGS